MSASQSPGRDGRAPPPEKQQREALLRRGVLLAVLSVCWDLVEGLVALAAGAASSSVALVGFGVDSLIETASAVIVGTRFAYEMKGVSAERAERAEKIASCIAGILLLLLAVYLLIDSSIRLFGRGVEPRPSFAGIAISALALVVMPLLGRAKLKTAALARSPALRADAYETITCAWLSFATLAGLGLNAVLGWWWADPLAALVLVPLIVREGLEGIRGEDDEEEEP